jgi:uncharacterized LabA/DUF88 family protein
MAVKAMLFIDGSWMYHNRKQIVNADENEDFDIDYRKIPLIVKKFLESKLQTDVDMVKTHYFASIAINRPGFDNSKQRQFFEMLSTRCFYNTEVYELDFKNMEKSRHEKAVDIALAASMLYYAAVPAAYDIAVVIAGDYDYLPLYKRAKLLGKRVCLVGLHPIGEFYPTSPRLTEDNRLFDLPMIFMDDYAMELRLTKEERSRNCDGCAREEVTTWEGEKFYCMVCRAENHASRIDRVCDSCGKSESTTYTTEWFYCRECREEYNRTRGKSKTGVTRPM